MRKGAGLVAILVILLFALASAYWFFYIRPANPGGLCIQVITTARNPITGEVRDFPTPCDVPLGWAK